MSSWQVIVPEATTNLCTNPSFELGTTGWAATGTSSLAQDSTESWRGIYSLKGTFGGAGFIAQYTTTLPTVGVDYRLSARVWVPSNWNGGSIFINATSFGATETIIFQWTEGTDEYEKWHYLESSLNPAADVTGEIQIHFDGVPTSTRFIYIDGFQIEEKSTATTYCDGDQEGCSWQATAHASASDRSALSWAGGELQDLTDDLSLVVQQAVGMGTARGNNNIVDFAIIPGGDFQRRKIQTRRSGPRGVIKGCTLLDLHAKRAALNNALINDLGEPVRIRYTGAATPKILKWYYGRGLGYSRHDNFKEKITLTGDSTDPFWISENETSEILDSQDSTAFRYIAGRAKNTGAWGNMAMASNGSTIRAIVRAPDGTLYIGGDFAQINAVANTGGIAQYDPIAGTWSAVGTGVTGGTDKVNALIFDASGNLYAGGAFTQMGGIANTSRIAMWDGAAWIALGTGALNASVEALTIGLDGKVFAGGGFTQMGGVANTAHMAQWSGAAWSAMVSGAVGGLPTVYALATGTDGLIYAAGSFTSMGGVSANNIAYWDSSAWNAMSTGLNSAGFALAASSSNIIYAGGDFTAAGGTVLSSIAQWNGTTWSAMGTGSSADVYAIGVAPDGTVFASGQYTTLATIVFGRWNGSTWSGADIQLSGGTVYAILADNQDAVIESNYDLYIGFDLAGNLPHSGTITATNPGTTLFLPIIKLSRIGGTSATVISVHNETTGRELFLDYALLDGETLTIDTKEQSAVSSFWGSRADAVLRNSDFATFSLRRGGNTISCYVDTAGGPTITASLQGNAQFAGFDG